MKPMNMPARKLRRQIVADAEGAGAVPTAEMEQMLIAARAVRTKIKRHARSTK
jgi:hypothetical protein